MAVVLDRSLTITYAIYVKISYPLSILLRKIVLSER
jgi:hypothetical protein